MTYFYSQLLYLGSESLPQFSSTDWFTSVLSTGLFPLVSIPTGHLLASSSECRNRELAVSVIQQYLHSIPMDKSKANSGVSFLALEQLLAGVLDTL